ncbi:thermonuclease family protein [Polaribacter sp. BAL334]|uniref:thermonuclease family protein n=1 Tax=Polaribacter sp. BAL334 TaxID=1708178 RepID=UPI0018D261B2|nr:thermonuclease family protein [Polaribacter sp. BAL334]MBG7612314.1 thermonuclease family protein [Polaribacter sp. BAL334]
MTHFNSKEPIIEKHLQKVVRFVDGDGLILEDKMSKNQFEVRFLGIDAPEMKICDKIKKDEKELNLPASFLIELGYLSYNFLRSQVNLGDNCKLIQEKDKLEDKYGRQLGYLVLNDGRVLNEIMIKEGYAKPYTEVSCEMLPLYQEWNLEAKSGSKGLYSLVNKF